MTADETPAMVLSHIFTPPAGEPWARCVICRLSEAAHAVTAEPYATPGLPYRCPYCVDRGLGPCAHGLHDALDMDGKRLHPVLPLGGAWCATPALMEMERRRIERGETT